MMEDLTGRVFTRWLVLGRAPDQNAATAWYCVCQCGTKRIVRTTPLRKEKTRSCGCYAAHASSVRSSTHGMRATKEYKTWGQIKRRCRNPNEKSYASYGALGIDICEEWSSSFVAFFAAVGPAPTPKHSIDRIDNARGYEPGNVRWATSVEQSRNRRNNRWMEAFGERKLLVDWSRDPRCPVSQNTFEMRIRSGWPLERAMTEPLRGSAR